MRGGLPSPVQLRAGWLLRLTHSPFPPGLGCQTHTGKVEPLDGTLEKEEDGGQRSGTRAGQRKEKKPPYRFLMSIPLLCPFAEMMEVTRPTNSNYLPPTLKSHQATIFPLLYPLPSGLPHSPIQRQGFSHRGCHSQSSLHRRPGDKGSRWVRWDPQAYPTHQRGGRCQRSPRASRTQDFCMPRGRGSVIGRKSYHLRLSGVAGDPGGACNLWARLQSMKT